MHAIDLNLVKTLGSCAALGSVGYMGAYRILPYMNGVSPWGVAVSCCLTPIIGFGLVAYSHKSSQEMADTANKVKKISLIAYFISFPLAYSIAVVSTNLAFRVQFLHPLVCFAAGCSLFALAVGVAAAAFFVFYRLFNTIS